MWSAVIACCQNWIWKLDIAIFFWDVLHKRHETQVGEFLVPQLWLYRGLVRNSSPVLFCFTPRTLENGAELLQYNFFIFSIIRCLSTIQFCPSGIPLDVITPCKLICLLVLWTNFYSKYYPVSNWCSILKVSISVKTLFSVIVSF